MRYFINWDRDSRIQAFPSSSGQISSIFITRIVFSWDAHAFDIFFQYTSSCIYDIYYILYITVVFEMVH
jgi:hypothetical protein